MAGANSERHQEDDMRIAVTSMGKDLDSQIDPRFGRATYILVIEPDGSLAEVVDNATNVNAMRGAGIQAAKALADRGVGVLLTGHCGPNAFTTLKAAGITVGIEQSGTVREAFQRYQLNQVKFADNPNVEGHW